MTTTNPPSLPEPTTEDIVLAAFKAFSRTPVHAYTMREAVALGLVQRNFSWRGRMRMRLGRALLFASGMFRRLFGKQIPFEESATKRLLDGGSHRPSLTIPASLRGLTPEMRARVANESGTTSAMDAIRMLFPQE
jgi:hypothetical protein